MFFSFVTKIFCQRKVSGDFRANRRRPEFPLLGLVFQVLKASLIKMCKIEPKDLLFLVVFINFYISRCHFHKFLELYSVLSISKIFVTNFLF